MNHGKDEPQISQISQIFFWVGLSAEHVLERIYPFNACHVRNRDRRSAAGKKAFGRKFRPTRRNKLGFRKGHPRRTARSPKPVIGPNPNPKICVIGGFKLVIHPNRSTTRCLFPGDELFEGGSLR
jgi:hypothetical protein